MSSFSVHRGVVSHIDRRIATYCVADTLGVRGALRRAGQMEHQMAMARTDAG